MKKYGIITGFVCVILFIYIFMHEEDPYYAYDNIVLNIAAFSEMSASLANGTRWLFNSVENARDFLVDVLDHMFTIDIPTIIENLTYGPLLRIKEMFDELFGKWLG